MNRRGFLRRLGLGIAGFALSRQLSGILPAPPVLAAPEGEVSSVIGIAMRYQRQWNAAQSQILDRLDVFYGLDTIRPDFVCRVVDEPSWWERFRARLSA